MTVSISTAYRDDLARLTTACSSVDESEKKWVSDFLQELSNNIGSISFSKTTLQTIKTSLRKVKENTLSQATTLLATTILKRLYQHEEMAQFAAIKACAHAAKTSLEQMMSTDLQKIVKNGDYLKKLKQDINHESYILQDHIEALTKKIGALEAQGPEHEKEILPIWKAIYKMQDAIKESVGVLESVEKELLIHRQEASLEIEPATPTLPPNNDQTSYAQSVELHIEEGSRSIKNLEAIRKKLQKMKNELPLGAPVNPLGNSTHSVYKLGDTIFKKAESYPELNAFDLCGLLGAPNAITPSAAITLAPKGKLLGSDGETIKGLVQPRIKDGFECTILRNRPDLGQVLLNKLDVTDTQLKIFMQIVLGAWDLHLENGMFSPKETTEYVEHSEKSWEFQLPDGSWKKLNSFYEVLCCSMDTTITENTKVRHDTKESSERFVKDDEELKKALAVQWQCNFFDNARIVGFERTPSKGNPNYLANTCGTISFPTRLFPLGLELSDKPLTQDVRQFIKALEEKLPFIKKQLELARFCHIRAEEKNAYLLRIAASIEYIKASETGNQGNGITFNPTLSGLHNAMFPVAKAFMDLVVRIQNIRTYFEQPRGVAKIQAHLEKRKIEYTARLQTDSDVLKAQAQESLGVLERISILCDSIIKFLNTTQEIAIAPKKYPYSQWGVDQAKVLKTILTTCIEFLMVSEISEAMKNDKKQILEAWLTDLEASLRAPFSEQDHKNLIAKISSAVKTIYDYVETANIASITSQISIPEDAINLETVKRDLYLETTRSLLGKGYGYFMEPAETILQNALTLRLLSKEKDDLLYRLLSGAIEQHK